MTTPDPAAHEAHETGLAERIVERAIGEWLDTATGLARASAGSPTSEYERGRHAGIDSMRHLHLDNWWYTVAPKLITELRRAGLLAPAATEGSRP